MKAALLALLFATQLFASTNDTAWRGDVRYVTAELPKRHANAFACVSRADPGGSSAVLQPLITMVQSAPKINARTRSTSSSAAARSRRRRRPRTLRGSIPCWSGCWRSRRNAARRGTDSAERRRPAGCRGGVPAATPGAGGGTAESM